MTLLMALLIAAIIAAILHAAHRHHRTTELPTQTPREVADNLRPHGAMIHAAPAHPPRHTPTKVD